jgi:hypothetical protein
MPPEYVPTADQRALVENAAAFGITQADIAEQLGIQEKTLRKHFRRELNGGKFKVDMLAGKTVTELMKDKDARVRLEAAKGLPPSASSPIGSTPRGRVSRFPREKRAGRSKNANGHP